MEMINAIDPLSVMSSNINVGKIHSKKDVEREFVGIFISQVMGNVFKGESSIYGDEGALGMYSNSLYNDIMLAKISKEIAENKAFGFEKLLEAGTKW